jgi:short-subunit dehydrogenase
MRLKESTILITGAAGGIGSCTAKKLASEGARLLLTDFRSEPLDALAQELAADGVSVETIPADVSKADDRTKLAREAADFGVSVLVNVAGINPFGLFSEQSDEQVEKALAINTIAPILLCRALVPQLMRCEEAHIVNVGSVFGSLGYPGFSVYSASKYAVRGFTEALRRELSDTSIRMHYVSPRATRTALSTDRISAMNRELRVATDPPERVATAIAKSLSHSRREVYVGVPERIFGLLNAMLPGVIDRALCKQLPTIRRYASVESREPSGVLENSVNVNFLGAQR